MAGLKTGAEAAAMANAAEQQQNKQYFNRFWMPPDPNKNVRVTFLDGDIDPATGELRPQAGRNEHNMMIKGKWGNHFNCTYEDGGDCPLCLRNEKASYVTFFTVINHTPYKSTKTGKDVVNYKELYACKIGTLRQLGHIAKQHTTLKGLTLDIARLDAKSAATGSMFSVVANFKTGQGLPMAEVFHGQTDVDLAPYDYMEALDWHTPDQLRGIFGTGASQNVDGTPAAAGTADAQNSQSSGGNFNF